jgi:hypothetical protein
MTAPEVAEEFGISAQAVREAAANQRIPARKVGRDWIIKHQDAEQRWGKGARRKREKPASGSRSRAGLREARRSQIDVKLKALENSIRSMMFLTSMDAIL